MNSAAVKRRFLPFGLTPAYGQDREATRAFLAKTVGRGSRVGRLRAIDSSFVLLSRCGKHSWALSTELGSIELAIGEVCTTFILPPVSVSDHPILAVFVGLEACAILMAGITARLASNWPFWALSLLGNDAEALLEAGSAGAGVDLAMGAFAHGLECKGGWDGSGSPV